MFDHLRPVMTISLSMYSDNEESQTQIQFLNGNKNFQMLTPDKIEFDRLTSINILNGIIEFILSDHDYISEFDKFNNTIHLKFVVNWSNEAMRGISCGDIDLNVELGRFSYQSEFPNQNEVLDYYIKGIVNRFHQELKNTETYKKEYKKYIALEKAQIINSLTEEELQLFLQQLTTEDICSLLLTLSDDRFREIYDDFEQAKEQKRLIKQIEEKNK